MVEDVLLRLLLCKTNDAMNKSLLPGVVHAKEGERKIMVVSGLRLVEWGRVAFIGESILWIDWGAGVGCLRAGECFLHGACGCGWRFQSVWIAGAEKRGDWGVMEKGERRRLLSLLGRFSCNCRPRWLPYQRLESGG